MVPATAVVGLPDEGTVEKYLMTGKSRAAVNPTAVNPTLTNATIVQTDTETVLTFTKPLVEEGGLTVSEDGSNTIIYAVGRGNDWSNFHFLYGSVSVDFAKCTSVVDAVDAVPTMAPVAVTVPVVPEVMKDSETSAPVAVVAPTVPVGAEDLDCSFYRNLEILPDLLNVREVVNPTDGTVSMELTYTGLGWISLAFSSNGFMVGNMAIVGLPDSDTVTKYFLGGKRQSAITLAADDQQTLTDTAIMQNETHTVMKFTKPLVEEGELAVSVTGVNRVIFGTGTSNDFRVGFHNNFGAFEVTLTSCSSAGADSKGVEDSAVDLFNDEVPNQGLWKVHGIFMAVGWGLLVPLAIGASLCRNLMPQGMWFVLHRGLNAAALLCNIIGFAIAVYLVGDAAAPGEKAKHFADIFHRTAGLIVFILAIVQVALAVIRPSNHSKDTKEKNDSKMSGTNHTSTAGPSQTFTVTNEAEARGSSDNSSDDDDSSDSVKPMVRTLWELKHKILGVAMLGLSWYNIHSGIDLYYERFGEGGADMTVLFWSVAGGLVAVLAAATVVAKTRSS